MLVGSKISRLVVRGAPGIGAAAPLAWFAVACALCTAVAAGAQSPNQDVVGSVSIETTFGNFSIDLEEDNASVREFARAFASLVKDRTFFHKSDKRIGCDAEDTANCFLCDCDYTNATMNCLGQAVGVCTGDPNLLRTCTNPAGTPEFRVNDLLTTSAVLHAGRFELDDGNQLLEAAGSLPVQDPTVPGIFANNAFTVAFVRDASGSLTPEWIVNLEDNSLLFDDEDNAGAAAHFVIGQISLGSSVVLALAGLETTDARCNATLMPETDAAIRSELEQIPVVDFMGQDEPALVSFCNPGDAGYLDCLQPDCITLEVGGQSCEEPLCYSVSELPEADQTADMTHFCDFPEQPNFPLITIAEPDGLTLVNNGLAPPEPRNELSYPNNPQLIVDVRNVGCGLDPDDPPGDCNNPGVPTFLEVTANGSTSQLRTSDDSRCSVTGGSVDRLELFDSARGSVSGGSVPELSASEDSDLALLGGSIGAWTATDSSTGLVSGGDLADIDARDDSLIRIVGDAFEVDAQPVPFGPLTQTSGNLTGTLASGEPLTASFDQAGATAIDAIHLLSSSDRQARADGVGIGDPGNTADPDTGLGAVPYRYTIGQTEVSNADYVEFLSAVAFSDPHELYDTRMGSDSRGGILRSGADTNYRYASISGRADHPVVFVSLFDAMRYANWKHNGEPVPGGDQDTETGPYLFVDGVLQGGRQPGARYLVPTRDEWYKAAYYDPATSSYFDYPTASNSEPSSQPPTRDIGNGANAEGTAGGALSNDQAPLTDVGAYRFSASATGTLDQAGNVLEWHEDSLDLMGGHWNLDIDRTRRRANPLSVSGMDAQENFLGFRVPEPTAGLLASVALATLAALRRRRQRSVLDSNASNE